MWFLYKYAFQVPPESIIAGLRSLGPPGPQHSTSAVGGEGQGTQHRNEGRTWIPDLLYSGEGEQEERAGAAARHVQGTQTRVAQSQADGLPIREEAEEPLFRRSVQS